MKKDWRKFLRIKKQTSTTPVEVKILEQVGRDKFVTDYFAKHEIFVSVPPNFDSERRK